MEIDRLENIDRALELLSAARLCSDEYEQTKLIDRAITHIKLQNINVGQLITVIDNCIVHINDNISIYEGLERIAGRYK
jgi:hypothetical protein